MCNLIDLLTRLHAINIPVKEIELRKLVAVCKRVCLSAGIRFSSSSSVGYNNISGGK